MVRKKRKQSHQSVKFKVNLSEAQAIAQAVVDFMAKAGAGAQVSGKAIFLAGRICELLEQPWSGVTHPAYEVLMTPGVTAPDTVDQDLLPSGRLQGLYLEFCAARDGGAS